LGSDLASETEEKTLVNCVFWSGVDFPLFWFSADHLFGRHKHFVWLGEVILSVVTKLFPSFGRVHVSWSQTVFAGLPNNSFTGRGRVTLNYGRHDGHAPVQWMFDVSGNQVHLF
jgi:hypothetical protein